MLRPVNPDNLLLPWESLRATKAKSQGVMRHLQLHSRHSRLSGHGVVWGVLFLLWQSSLQALEQDSTWSSSSPTRPAATRGNGHTSQACLVSALWNPTERDRQIQLPSFVLINNIKNSVDFRGIKTLVLWSNGTGWPKQSRWDIMAQGTGMLAKHRWGSVPRVGGKKRKGSTEWASNLGC